MNKAKLALLEKAFAAEIRAALQGGPHVMQTARKMAQELCNEGLLYETEEIFRRVRVKGYALTHAGRAAYCESCDDPTR